MSFISDHIEVFQLLASLTTTAVWLVYLNIFLRGFRQQRRSSLLINRGGGEDLDSRCLISNMGAQPAYLLDVVASLEAEDGPVVASVIDRKELQRDQMTNPADLTGQGPMASGARVMAARALLPWAGISVVSRAGSCSSSVERSSVSGVTGKASAA